MKSFTSIRYLGVIACAATLILGPPARVAFAQEPPIPMKQPPLPRGKRRADPRLPTEANPDPKGNDGGTGDQKLLKSPDKSDTHFAMNAAEGSILEVELGRLASEKASNAEVKEFASRMITDHTRGNMELKAIAESKDLALPAVERVKAKHQGRIQKLEKLEGAAFDRAYMADMVKDYDKDVALFEKQANSGRDAALQEFGGRPCRR